MVVEKFVDRGECPAFVMSWIDLVLDEFLIYFLLPVAVANTVWRPGIGK